MAAVIDRDLAPAIDFTAYRGEDVEQESVAMPPGWDSQAIERPALVRQLKYQPDGTWELDPPPARMLTSTEMVTGTTAEMTRSLMASTGGAAPNVRFPRPLHRGMSGWDVRAHKRAVSRAFPDLYPWPTGKGFTDFFGEQFEKGLKKAQARMAIMSTGKLGLATHEALERKHRKGHPKDWAFDAAAIELAADFARLYAKSPEDRIREAIVSAWAYWESLNSKISYAQERPYGLYKPPAYERRMDCSEFYALGCFAGGAKDPNGFGYNGFGYTGSLIAHTARCDITDLEPGDLVFYGSSSGRPGFGRGDPTHVAGYGGIQYSPERGRSVRVIYTMGSSRDPRLRPIDYRHDLHSYAKLAV